MGQIASTKYQVSASTRESLPLEIIFMILYFALESNPSPNTVLQFTLLSRAVHAQILPHLYHTLNLIFNETCPSRAVLIRNAPRSSLLFTRRVIISRNSSISVSVCSFSRLSHLALWGRNFLYEEQAGQRHAREIVMLPLEELFVWEQNDSTVLLQELSPDATIWQTIQRFGCIIRTNHIPRPDEGWLGCPNLVQVLAIHGNIEWFLQMEILRLILPSSRTFKSFILSPGFASLYPLAVTPETAWGYPIKDRRLLVLRRPLHYHFFKYRESFWDNQSTMWKFMLEEIEKNGKINEMTVVEDIPWSEVIGGYEVSRR
ncbi:hypothetical protein DL96DRAFT_1821524 [Flagelloscypha sp. PMI_526]|nr:hypothetical protein DL96DRAFT_1821524 [Flagelloscypha sp. PMI_526]